MSSLTGWPARSSWDQRRTWKKRSLIVAGFATALLGPWVNQANADKKIDATKTITWTIKGAAPGPNDNVFGDLSWDLLASAKDNHGGKDLSEKNATTWKIGAGLPDFVRTTGLAFGPVGVEPSAKADITFAAGKPVVVAGKPTTVTGSMHLVLEADTVPATPAHGDQHALADGSGKMTVRGGTVTNVEISQPGAVTVTSHGEFKAGEVGFGGNAGAMRLHDPISVRVDDLTAGTSLEQTLFDSSILATADGIWKSDAGGFSISAPNDGISSIALSLKFLSSWITDASLVDSDISFMNGVFSATGIFSAMPWVVTASGASLAPGIFDSITIPYQVPIALLDPSHLYQESLTVDESGVVEVAASAASVPEPSTIILGASGLLAFAVVKLRTRCATRLFH